MPAEVDVCVVGAGLAGIAAALEASQGGARVQVLEAHSAAGGKAQTVDGLETGPHSFAGRHQALWRLLELLRLDGEAAALPEVTHTRYLARGGRLHRLAPSPLTLLTTSALSLAEKRAIARDLLGRRPVAPAASVHDFFAARFTESFAQGPLAALLSGIFSADPRQLSLEACFPGLAARAASERSVIRGLLKGPRGARRGFFTLAGGLGRMGAAAERLLPIELAAPVRELAREASGFRVTHARGTLHARAVVVATEAPSAAKLLWPLSQPLGAALGQLRYAALSKVHWRSAASGFRPGFGYLACPGEGLFALGTLFRPEGFTTFVRGAGHADEALVAGVRGDVERLTAGRLGEVLRIDRWPHAVFQPTLEALPARESLPGLAAQAGVVLAGSYLGAAALKDAAASGFAAGRQALKLAQGTTAWSRSLS